MGRDGNNRGNKLSSEVLEDSHRITQFKGPYAFLSNFFPASVVLDKEIYPSVEHAFQAAKTLDTKARMFIRFATQAASAKKLGSHVWLRPDWEEIKLRVMYDLVKQKFSRHKELRRRLLATGQRELIEGNWWGDNFWGVALGPLYVGGSGNVGLNHLGKILMRVRGEIST